MDATRFARFNEVAGQIEIQYGFERGVVHFTHEELTRNDDQQMFDLFDARVTNWREVLAMRRRSLNGS